MQDFSKEGAPKLRTDRILPLLGTGSVWGGCAHSEVEKNVISKVIFAWLDAFLCLNRTHKIRHPISSKNKLGARATCAPSKSAPKVGGKRWLGVIKEWIQGGIVCQNAFLHIGPPCSSLLSSDFFYWSICYRPILIEQPYTYHLSHSFPFWKDKIWSPNKV